MNKSLSNLMLKYHFIFICFHLVFNPSCADFWCSDHELETLIQCLLDQPIKAEFNYNIFYRRLLCALNKDCTPPPWLILDDSIRLAKNFAECMKDIANFMNENQEIIESVPAHRALGMFEEKCRKNLAENLPDHLKLYYNPLLGQ